MSSDQDLSFSSKYLLIPARTKYSTKVSILMSVRYCKSSE